MEYKLNDNKLSFDQKEDAYCEDLDGNVVNYDESTCNRILQGPGTKLRALSTSLPNNKSNKVGEQGLGVTLSSPSRSACQCKLQ